ncbi:alkene reductase [Oceanicella actignis]|uniref:N-ethylmaleimide reductase n=1 Tax=Oceanicella actignis TaxID=1189325 RepID=A0A1M7U2Z4_9RHOB|nr:alkene reductase [Oceanicella actignis]SET86560.1 N-ethylmaleimide reductase [Oceanicella actignis]SHN77293.1 N-ethylmaleimide reductase [Oceanicella actignis]
MSEHPLFQPVRVGEVDLANRVVMAPLTRNRADPATDAVTDLTAEYYAQRASAGLIITEASQISPEGKGYAWTPGIHSPTQVAAWRKVVDAVHARGGKIFVQLWHVGRISHVSLQPGGQAPVSSTDRPAKAKTFDGKDFVDTSAPRRLEASEIPRILADYRAAARNAMEAGFDGVELHAANGYLIDQFLKDGVNDRDDAYGGSLENRSRLLVEAVEAILAEVPAGRVGVRVSPFSTVNDAADSNPKALAEHVVARLDPFGLAYLHLVEGQTGGPRDLPEGVDLTALRKAFRGAWMVNNGYDREMAMKAVESGYADLVAFGRPFISNPDLVERLRRGAPLNPLDTSTLYGGGAKGYTDYPTLDQLAEA